MIAYLGFNVGLRSWVDQNGATIEKFLAAVSEADKWMRANPKQAAQVATRWIPGIKPDVAEAAMQFNIQQADRRLSANNYRALWAAQEKLLKGGFLKSTFDVNKHIEPKYIVKVMREHPQLFNDLPPIPAGGTALRSMATRSVEHALRPSLERSSIPAAPAATMTCTPASAAAVSVALAAA